MWGVVWSDSQESALLSVRQVSKQPRLAGVAREQYAANMAAKSTIAIPKLTSQLEVVLAALEVLSVDPQADVHCGSLRAQLEQAGKPIGANDLLIAAQSLSLGYTLVTDNEENSLGARHEHRELASQILDRVPLV